MDTRLYWIWLQQAIGAGNPLASRLMEHFPNAQAVYEADETELKMLCQNTTVQKHLLNKSMRGAEDIFEKARKNAGWVLTPDDVYYPSMLRSIYALPLVLYGRGTMPDLNTFPSISMVGTREMTEYGRKTAYSIGAGLAAAGMILVSGGARGGDELAMEGALSAGGIVVCVQACGLDRDYPKVTSDLRRRVLEKGVLLSEYPCGTEVRKHSFLIRNRLMSGMTLGTCVVEAPMPSGSLNTARHAREQGRDVFAVPGPVTSPVSVGTNALIQEGAKLVRCAGDILDEYEGRFGDLLDRDAASVEEERVLRRQKQARDGWFERPNVIPFRKKSTSAKVADVATETVKNDAPAQPTPCPESASAEAKQIFSVLTDQPTPVDEVAQKASLSVSRTLSALTELEIYGCVRSGAGQSYCRN